MNSIAEIAELYLTNLSEGILDDFDTTIAKTEEIFDTEHFEKWSENSTNKCYWRNTKKGWVLQGTFTIKDYTDKQYNGPKIKSLKGKLNIINCDFENLNGIFAPECIIEGSLTIQNCKNITSLEGAPDTVDTLTVMGNPKLKSLLGGKYNLIFVKGNLYAMKNGKKFDAEKIRDKDIFVGKKIFCNLEDEPIISENIINESFNNPHLILLDKQLKQPKYKKNGWTLKSVLSHDINDIEFDKLNNSETYEYDHGDPKAFTMVKKVVNRHNATGLSGIVLLMNHDGEYTHMICKNHVTDFTFEDKDYTNWYNKPRADGSSSSIYTIELLVAKADTTIVILYKGGAGRTYTKRTERSNARSGAIALDRGKELSKQALEIDPKKVRYYQNIADENRSRYKKMLETIRANRTNQAYNNFDKIQPQIDNILTRYTKVLTKVMKNPTAYGNNGSWLIGYIDDALKETIHGRTKYDYKTVGLMYLVRQYTNLIINASQGSTYMYRTSTLKDRIKEYEDQILGKIQYIDNKLKELEAI